MYLKTILIDTRCFASQLNGELLSNPIAVTCYRGRMNRKFMCVCGKRISSIMVDAGNVRWVSYI